MEIRKVSIDVGPANGLDLTRKDCKLEEDLIANEDCKKKQV